MNVSLTPELEKLVAEKVESGKYPTADDVVREGLQLLKARDEEFEAHRRAIREGFEEIECGEYEDYDDDTLKHLFEDVKVRGRLRLAELKQNTGTR